MVPFVAIGRSRSQVEYALLRCHELAILARSEDTLFQIVLDPEKDTATLVSRPLKRGNLSVGLILGEPSTSEEQVTTRETSWTFRMAGQADELDAWKRITGRIAIGGTHGKRFDRRERLARNSRDRLGGNPVMNSGSPSERMNGPQAPWNSLWWQCSITFTRAAHISRGRIAIPSRAIPRSRRSSMLASLQLRIFASATYCAS